MPPDAPVEVVTLGECLAAFVATDHGPLADVTAYERHIAGAEANVAVGLARLGHAVAYIGRVGPDGHGTAVTRRLRGEGVDVRHLRVDPDAPTGVLFRERRALGAIDVVYHRAGSAGSRLMPDHVDAAAADGAFTSARWIHVTGITPALSHGAHDAVIRAIDLGREAGATISLDVNLRRRLWSDEAAGPVLRALASRVHVVLGSVDELAVIADADPESEPTDLVAAVTALGPSTAAAKLGADGAVGLEVGGTPVHEPRFRVDNVVDPVGAGDAFCAGFIAGRLDGVDLHHALRMGNACGALAVASAGDQSGLPDRAELGRLLAGGPDTIR